MTVVQGAEMTNILVADDAADAAETLGFLFETLGHETHVAFNGRQAVAQARKFVPHIIFLDLDMPQLDGYGAARAIRAAPDADHPFIVALTGQSGVDTQRMVKEAGFDFYIHKPADTGVLMMLVDDLARRERNDRAP